MSSYNLIIAPLAKHDLNIYDYSVSNWGARQVSDYLDKLKEHFWELAEQPKRGIEREELLPGMRSFPVDSHVVFYRLQQSQVEVHFGKDTVWLSQAQMVELFDKNKRTVSEYIRNIFKEGELEEEPVVRKSRTTADDGKTYNVNRYNLDVVISAGYMDFVSILLKPDRTKEDKRDNGVLSLNKSKEQTDWEDDVSTRSKVVALDAPFLMSVLNLTSEESHTFADSGNSGDSIPIKNTWFDN